MPYQPGDILLDTYRIEALIAEGSFGEVYRVTHLGLKVERAIKVLKHGAPSVGNTTFDTSKGRFQMEAQLGAQLNTPTAHPNLLQVHNFHSDEKLLLLELEYAPGGSLAEKVARARKNGQPIPIDEVIQIGVDVASGLAALHERDIVHRDLKPSNILFDEKERAKVADLGFAQIPGGSSMRSQLSEPLPHPGTPGWKSPEQERSGEYLLPASDVYALGLVLFYTLTGRMYASQPPGTSPRDLRPDTPPWLDDQVTHMLAEDPRERPWDGNQVRASLWRKKQQTKGERTRWTWGVLAVVVVLVGMVTLARKERGGSTLTAATAVIGALPATVSPQMPVQTSQPSMVSTRSQEVTTAPSPLPLTPADTPVPSPTLASTSIPPPTITALPTLQAGATMIAPVDRMVMMYVPAGEFLMGAGEFDSMAETIEKPQHPVYLEAYWIDQTEVTNAMFAKFVSATGYRTETEQKGSVSYWYERETGKWREASDTDWLRPYGPGSDIDGRENHPVIHITWKDAQMYCAWAKRRLPTEAEWEKAARDNDERIYPWGNTPPNNNLSNFNWLENDTSPVGSYPAGASPYGVLDMAGNVWEWIADWYSEDYYSVSPYRNPTGPSMGDYRLVRGGGWNNRDAFVRATNRHFWDPLFRSVYLGFRCAMDAEP